MPSYTYRARDGVGKAIRGVMNAGSKVELTDKLHKLGYMVTQIQEPITGLRIDSLLEHFETVKTEDMVIFNVQLSNLLQAGVPLLASLLTVSQQIENKKLRDAIRSISTSVESGESFSTALLSHPKIFSSLFVNMVRVGEASGKLDIVLSRYAGYCEKQADLSQKIKSAIFYPVILLFAGIAVTLFIVTTVIPQFAEIFMRAGIQLPLPTRILFFVGTSIKQFWFSMILFLIVVFMILQYYAGTKKGRMNVDRLKLKTPLFSSLVRKAGISRFARTFGMLVASGVPILESMQIVKDLIGNEVLKQVVEQARYAVEKGEKISEPLRISGEFPPDAIQMILVGEETGKLDEMLQKVADFYDRSVDYMIKKLTVLLEPILLIFMGCLVGFIMASLLLPMFDMVQVLRR